MKREEDGERGLVGPEVGSFRRRLPPSLFRTARAELVSWLQRGAETWPGKKPKQSNMIFRSP